jgi:hypothetical protein
LEAIVKRKTLDLLFSIGGVALAALLVVLGFVLEANANFARDYVRDQMGEQQISFTPKEALSPEEAKADCLVENAGKPLETGKQAECYANEYIGLHLAATNDGKTYAQTSNEARPARAAADEATANGAPDAAALTAKADELDAKVQTLFRGETLRGLLLTSYGFSVFGEKASQAALVCFLVAAVLTLASIAGFVHASSRRGEQQII